VINRLFRKHKDFHHHGDGGIAVEHSKSIWRLNNDVGPLAGKVVLGEVKFCFHKFILTQG
jgi:hypothetical protein